MTNRRALTMIEVVASLVLVATTVTALLVAHGRSLEQAEAIKTAEIANTLANELITVWRLEPLAPGDRHGRPARHEGAFASHPRWRWTRITEPAAQTLDQTVEQITLRVFKEDNAGQEQLIREVTWLARQDLAGASK